MKYDYPLYEIVSSEVLESVRINNVDEHPEKIPGWWHVYYPGIVDYEIRGRIDDTGINVIELKCEKDKDAKGAIYTMTLHRRRRIEKKTK